MVVVVVEVAVQCTRRYLSHKPRLHYDQVFTDDVEFLDNTQAVVDEMEMYDVTIAAYELHHNNNNAHNSGWSCEDLAEIWEAVKVPEEQDFLEKYMYMDWSIFKHLNNSEQFLQTLSLVNLSSPVVSILMPFLMLFLPLLILRFRDVPISYDCYMETLRDIAKNHFLGRATVAAEESSWTVSSLAYMAMMSCMYVLQMYHNVKAVSSFYTNISKINSHLCLLQRYLKHSIFSMTTFIRMHSSTGNKSKYMRFLAHTQMHVDTLQELSNEIGAVTEFSETVSKVFEFGHLLKCYYRLRAEPQFGRSLQYSFGFAGYIEHLGSLHRKIKNRELHFLQFKKGEEEEEESGSKNVKNLEFVNQYYVAHHNGSTTTATGAAAAAGRVTNSCVLQPNMIVTGPNASGKTTYLKTTMLNVLFGQQFGCGCFGKGSRLRQLYTHLHSYLNIPDTSERDSLFQAESRRCKNILDEIRRHADPLSDRHFCIFDELYSGTNPDDAVKTATSFLKYICKWSNVDFILTTHYVAICEHFETEKEEEENATAAPLPPQKVSNYQMRVLVDSSTTPPQFTYTYKLDAGISRIHGSLNVLRNMDYPDEIIADLA